MMTVNSTMRARAEAEAATMAEATLYRTISPLSTQTFLAYQRVKLVLWTRSSAFRGLRGIRE